MANEELIAEAEMGEEARKFLAGDLGKCLVGLAHQEVELAQEALETVSPTDTEAIRDLQFKARFGRQFEGWLRSLVADGDNAIQVFKQSQET